MIIKVRHVASGNEKPLSVSKIEAVADVKKEIQTLFGIVPSKQRLFFGGKQLEIGFTLFDYKIDGNVVIQLMERVDDKIFSQNNELCCSDTKNDRNGEIPCDCQHFKVGDIVDAVDPDIGGWFEGEIFEIVKCLPDEEIIYYKVKFFQTPFASPSMVTIDNIRPRASRTATISSLQIDNVVLVNFNESNPGKLGYWFDFKVDNLISENEVGGTLLLGPSKTPIPMTLDKRHRIFIKERLNNKLPIPDKRKIIKETAPFCEKCKDVPTRKCKDCGCYKCQEKKNPDKQLVCDECQNSFHIWCLNTPLDKLPDDDEWYCDNCKTDEDEVVKAGQKPRESAKRAKMASANTKTKRDWGRGMACAGRSKICSVVPINHVGPIPGIAVGSSWFYRIQLAEAGVHRQHMAGICGRQAEGAFSIVISGGYEDDIDSGEHFFYTGSGGRDLSGNKRTSFQAFAQPFTNTNKALARSCVAKVCDKGAAATNWREAIPTDILNNRKLQKHFQAASEYFKSLSSKSKKEKDEEFLDWRKGQPVRVIRNYKLKKHSPFAPKLGNRYDGIYKVIRYYPIIGESGHMVWRYELVRDDPTPAPWTDDGKQLISDLGLKMEYPDNYLEIKNKENLSNKTGNIQSKRSREDDDEPVPAPKKILFNLEDTLLKVIKSDSFNSKTWSALLENLTSGEKVFLDKVAEEFVCVCCMEVVYNPVEMSCSHNVCMTCLKRSFASDIFTCPNCRADLGKNFNFNVNCHLQEALHKLFPGYAAAR